MRLDADSQFPADVSFCTCCTDYVPSQICWCYCSPEIYSARSVINCVHKWYCETNDQNHMSYVICVKRFPFASFGSRFDTNQALVTKWYEDI